MNTLPTTTGGAVTTMMPSTMREAMDLATMMSHGKLVPAALQGSPADCLMVIEQAMRWGMSPFAVAQEVSVIQGKMMFSGKIVAAAIHTSGVLDGRLDYQFTGKNGDLAVTVTGTLRGESAPRNIHVTLASAKTSNQHWSKSPEQMLTYHGARVWARRHAPEVMLGVYAPEEFEPETRHAGPTIEARVEPSPRAAMDATLHGDDIPSFDTPAPIRDKLAEAAERIERKLVESGTIGAYNAVLGNMAIADWWDRIKEERPDLAERLEAVRATALARISEQDMDNADEPEVEV